MYSFCKTACYPHSNAKGEWRQTSAYFIFHKALCVGVRYTAKRVLSDWILAERLALWSKPKSNSLEPAESPDALLPCPHRYRLPRPRRPSQARGECTHLPHENPGGTADIQWGKRLARVKNCLECLYGIPKRRSQILKNTVHFKNQGDIVYIMWTCFIHRYLSHKYQSVHDMVANLEFAGADRSSEQGGALAPSSEETVDSYASATVVENEAMFVGFRDKPAERFEVRAVNGSLAWYRS